jgi:Fe-S cluster assembly iron-binding protein IscA
MFEVSEKASDRIKEFLKKENKESPIRIVLSGAV